MRPTHLYEQNIAQQKSTGAICWTERQIINSTTLTTTDKELRKKKTTKNMREKKPYHRHLHKGHFILVTITQSMATVTLTWLPRMDLTHIMEG
jgi:hypothetical protein